MVHITPPLSMEQARMLKAGDSVLISGIIYTARDAAHKKMIEALENNQELPFDIKNQIIYYVGPCPAKPNKVIGSCGPTTSGRMDSYAPTLIKLGLIGMIGKGARTPEVYSAMQEYGAVYFGAIGGAGAMISKCVKSQEIVCYPELGAEAIRRLTVENLPVVVIADCHGGNIYATGKNEYKINN